MHELRAILKPADQSDAPRMDALLRLAQAMTADGTTPQAASRLILERLGDRWSPLLLFVLSTGRYRNGELRRVVNALSRMTQHTLVSQRMLTLRLRTLERDGLVSRTINTGPVPAVDYALTPLGAELVAHLHALMQWCALAQTRIDAAQAAFDRNPARASDAVSHSTPDD